MISISALVVDVLVYFLLVSHGMYEVADGVIPYRG